MKINGLSIASSHNASQPWFIMMCFHGGYKANGEKHKLGFRYPTITSVSAQPAQPLIIPRQGLQAWLQSGSD